MLKTGGDGGDWDGGEGGDGGRGSSGGDRKLTSISSMAIGPADAIGGFTVSMRSLTLATLGLSSGPALLTMSMSGYL